MPSIVLVSPLIPQNTGSIARMTAANYTTLHLIKPLGFELSDRYLKRAGLDYWKETDVRVHDDWELFLESQQLTPADAGNSMWFFTKKAEQHYHRVSYRHTDYLVFGAETHGLPDFLHEQHPERRVRIPMANPNVRSLNLATSAGIAFYEAMRQTGGLDTVPDGYAE